MALFATLERDSADADKLITLAHLASDFKAKLNSDPQKQLNILVYGYLTMNAASDSIKESIERDLMNKSLVSISRTLVQYGVPIDKLYFGEMVFSNSKARKIDLFLEQQGEAHHAMPGNPTRPGTRIPAVNSPQPAKNAELTVNKDKEVAVEITGYKVESGKRTLVPELAFKSSTAISPVAISKEFSAELTVWRPKLEALLKKIGQEGKAEKIEFSLKIVGGATLSKEFAGQISTEVAASLRAALSFNITIPGTNYELPVELSYSFGAAYRDGSISERGQGMVTVTLFRFKSL